MRWNNTGAEYNLLHVGNIPLTSERKLGIGVLIGVPPGSRVIMSPPIVTEVVVVGTGITSDVAVLATTPVVVTVLVIV